MTAESPITIDPQSHVVYAGELQLLRWSEASTSGRTVVFQLPEDAVEHPFKRFNVRDKSSKTPGKRFMVAFVEIGDDEKPVSQAPVERTPSLGGGKPFGKNASVLYRSGWMQNLKIMRAAGSQDELDAWLGERPCCMCGSLPAEANVDLLSPAGDATGYYAIPVCDQCTDSAKAVPEEAFHRKCVDTLQEWISQSISRQLGFATLGHVPPERLLAWAKEHGLEGTIPASYFMNRKEGS